MDMETEFVEMPAADRYELPGHLVDLIHRRILTEEQYLQARDLLRCKIKKYHDLEPDLRLTPKENRHHNYPALDLSLRCELAGLRTIEHAFRALREVTRAWLLSPNRAEDPPDPPL